MDNLTITHTQFYKITDMTTRTKTNSYEITNSQLQRKSIWEKPI